MLRNAIKINRRLSCPEPSQCRQERINAHHRLSNQFETDDEQRPGDDLVEWCLTDETHGVLPDEHPGDRRNGQPHDSL